MNTVGNERARGILQRDPAALAAGAFDVLVIGGGINGASCALDAASRGLSVALVERDDFAAATSSNSAKIAHSGLRYLQHGDFKRLRLSVNESNFLMQNAPHLLQPSSVLFPVEGHGIKGRETMAIYIRIYDLLSRSRRAFADPGRRIARSRMLSRRQAIGICEAVDRPRLTGVATWPEGQIYSTERLVIAVLRAARQLGAEIANRIEATELLVNDGRVAGVKATDRLTGESFEIAARSIVNATGPWVDRFVPNAPTAGPVPWSKAFSLLTRSLCDTHTVSFTIPPMYEDRQALVAKGGSVQFAIPWRGHSLLGSLHLPCGPNPDEVTISEDEIARYIALINEGYPSAKLTRADISRVLWGIIPADAPGSASPEKHGRFVDHASGGGPQGLFSVIGVKLTTSRALAEETVDAVAGALGSAGPATRTAQIPLWGGDIERIEQFFIDGQRLLAKLSPAVAQRLLRCYGTGLGDVLAFDDDPADPQVIPRSDVLVAEVRHALAHEAALSLADVVLRRTDVGSLACPPEEVLRAIARIMAGELGWDEARIDAEVGTVVHRSNYGSETGAAFVTC